MKQINILLLALFTSASLLAQDVLISDGGTVTVMCGGTSLNLTDSGGSGDSYEAGETFEMTFCPDGGNAIVFILDTETVGHQFDIAGSDILTVFNGDDTSAPVLDIISSTSILSSPVITLAATLDNPSGCLTFLWESSAGSVTGGGWTSAINCGNFWQPFEIDLSTSPSMVNDENYIDICQGETVNFSANGIFPFSDGNGYNQTNENCFWTWEFGDGSEVSGFGLTEVSNTYNEQFGYPVTITVTDSLGQNQLWEGGVRVSTTPNFSTMISQYQEEICLGNQTTLIGGIAQDTSQSFGVIPVQSAFIGGGFLAGQTFLPDGSGVSYETTIVIDDFPPGSTIESEDDIVGICATMEHSYLGDLDIVLSCPDGTSIILQNQAGGSCNLGIPWATAPVDGESTNLTPGVGLQYCWTANAPNGSLDSACPGTNQDFVSGDGPGTYSDTQVPAGDYTPFQPLSNLIGCPINGSWIITVTDNIGADNGYIFSWGVQFNPLIDPTVETYQPILVEGFWDSEPSIVANNDTIITVQPESTGSYNYTFHVTDDFGCEYDTTVVLDVLPPVAISAMSPACDFTSVVNVTNSQQGGSWTWMSDNADILSTIPDGNGNVENLSNIGGIVTYEYFDVFCDRTEMVDVFFKPYPVAGIVYNDELLMQGDTIELCLGDETILDNVEQPASITNPVYNWLSPLANPGTSELFVSADFTNQTDAQSMNGPYNILVSDADCPDYQASQQVIVSTEGCQPYNVFSPNNDGFNDVFYIGGVERLRDTQLWIYNRWGKVVYEASNYQNDYDMEGLSDGTYFYVLKSQSKGGEFQGSFTVVGNN